MKSTVPIFILSSFLFISQACKRDKDDIIEAKSPVIDSFSPTIARRGDTVIISGSSFSPTANGNIVNFATNAAAEVLEATTSQLKVIVPPTAVHGNISVTVGENTVASAERFTVLAAHSLGDISPATGFIGDTITINGSDFTAPGGLITVKFSNNATATLVEATATQLKVKVPAGAATGQISITVKGVTKTTQKIFELLTDIPRNGLVAFYPFNGNGNDISGNGYNLDGYQYTIINDRFGNAGKAIYFDGGNGFVLASNTAHASVSNPITIGCWVKYNLLIASTIVGKYSATNGGYLFGLGNNGTLTLRNNTAVINTATGVMPDNTNGQWVFIAMSYDGTTCTMYKNGAAVGTFNFPGSITGSNGANLRIGLSGYTTPGPEAFKCSVDDVTIYNRVLSNTEIQQLYEQTASKK